MTDLDGLIAKLEAATEGSLELDCDIEEIVFSVTRGNPPRYTTSIDAALTLVPSGERWEVGFCGAAVESSGGPIRSVHAEPAIALSIAALKARAA